MSPRAYHSFCAFSGASLVEFFFFFWPENCWRISFALNICRQTGLFFFLSQAKGKQDSWLSLVLVICSGVACLTIGCVVTDLLSILVVSLSGRAPFSWMVAFRVVRDLSLSAIGGDCNSHRPGFRHLEGEDLKILFFNPGWPAVHFSL